MKFGDKVKDIISGFTGIVTGKAQYMTGCNQTLVSQQDSAAKAEAAWFDDSRLKVVKQSAVSLPRAAVARNPGGPTPSGAPSRPSAPR